MVSRVCEEFGCLPSQAIAELEANDELVFDVLDSRAYSRAWEVVDAATSPDQVPESEMVDWVFLVQHELLKRRNDERG